MFHGESAINRVVTKRKDTAMSVNLRVFLLSLAMLSLSNPASATGDSQEMRGAMMGAAGSQQLEALGH